MLKAQGRFGGRTGTKILLEAMSQDKVHLARFVLDALDGEIVDFKTEDAQTPLISSILLADSHTRCKFIELLLERGANANCRDGDGRTALSYACEKGYLDAVKILVRNNADPEIVDALGNTALMYATVAGHSPVVVFLVRAFKRLGLQIDRRNKVGNSAVEVAEFLGHKECVFALTSGSRRGREAEGGAQGNAQPRLRFGCGDLNNFGKLVNKREVLETTNRVDCQLIQNSSWKSRPRMKQIRMPSIDEFERENDGSCSPAQELDFSGLFAPKPPSGTSLQSPNSKPPKIREMLTTSDDHLPSLIQSGESQKSIFFSPRPNRNAPKLSALSAPGILLTPINANKTEIDPETDSSNRSDCRVRRFHDCYYQKRCSVPNIILSPTPPERMLVPLRKSRRETSPCKVEAPQFTTPSASTSATTLSGLSNNLLRRFTSPEFKKNVGELEDPMSTPGRMQRSETFPQDVKHPQLDSKPSIDSISSVKCEFDFQFRMQNS